MFIYSIECIDGELFLHKSFTPITDNLEAGFWSVINKLRLMDHIDNKYYLWTLEEICRFDKIVRKNHQDEIEKIVGGFSDGEVW